MTARWYTVAQVMDELNRSRREVSALIRRGQLDAVKSGKSFRIARAAIDDYLERARVISQPAVRVPLQTPLRPRRRQQRTPGVELNMKGAGHFVRGGVS